MWPSRLLRSTGAGDDIDRLSEQINAALDRLRRLVEGMRQVSVDIAHDLKTPVSRLHIMLQSALDSANAGALDPTTLEDAIHETRQISDIFDALLGITQIEAGARKSRFSKVDLVEIVGTIYEAYEPVAVESGYELLHQECGVLARTRLGDRALLLQMLANLVENALRHTPPGGRITLGCRQIADAQVMEIFIADEGPGIPETEREKVFERLYRLEKSRTTPGSGLGLSLVKAIAELHDATVTLADAEPGLRVAIQFRLPTSPAEL